MRGCSRVNREEQVKVVIRLKPESGQSSKYSKCVYLSDKDERQLVVETDHKREIFLFDHVAHETATQAEVYRHIGQQCIQQSFEGYNCCIFAYGQTGAGKTYSVLGSLTDLSADAYCESRGVLPRLLEEVFSASADGQERRVSCSYMEIYNEQIFDLLSSDKRIHQIRQDAKKGVFVEGLTEKRISSYRQAVSLLLEGEKTRRMASTLMNTESSRSHAIFTVTVTSQVTEHGLTTTKKSKLHIVDLAGSERVKHTQVEGERLREGCNINRSLLVLGNVINSLVESTKKKKHVPFRDSKLTHYLKDSLGGNSITKLLANVHTSKQYFGDTLSTLMFAKRAKILKMKVQLNETIAENYDQLRKEVRKLREELAQARYFKSETRSDSRTLIDEDPPSKGVSEDHDLQGSAKSGILHTLQQNQLHYKALIEIYEEHMKLCLSSSNFQRKQNINIVKQWRNLQKRNISLTNLVKQMPAFSKIYKENVLLRQERSRLLENTHSYEENIKEKHMVKRMSHDEANAYQQGHSSTAAVENVITFYETLIGEMETRFRECLQTMQKSYLEMQGESKAKDKKIKDLKRKRQYPPNIEELRNQNEYLHLNILNLENEIAKFQQNEQRMRLELKQSKKSIINKQELNDYQDGEELAAIIDKLQQIKKEAQRQSDILQAEKAELQAMVKQLQLQINKLVVDNNRLRDKYSRSRSKRKSSRKSQPDHKSLLKSPEHREFLNEEAKYSNRSISLVDDELKSMQQTYAKEILLLKMDIKRKMKEIVDLKKELEVYVSGDKRIEEEFGKPLEELIEDFREINHRRSLQQSKSAKILHKWKEAEPVYRHLGRSQPAESKYVPRGKEPRKDQARTLAKRCIPNIVK